MSAQGLFFIQSEQVKRNLLLPALAFSIELAGSPKSPVGALNPQALLGHICLPCISHFKENFLFLPLRKKSRLSSWALRLEPVLSHYTWPHLLRSSRKARALARVYFPLLLPYIHLPHNELQGHLL